jgi:hypothetical protein
MKGVPERKLVFEHLGPCAAHGTRVRYVSGCRCDACRAANTAYIRELVREKRAGNGNPAVSAERARAHLEGLSRQGVGRRSVADTADVSETVLSQIKSGARQSIRKETERRILAVTPEMAADHALIDAAATLHMVQDLVDAGFTRKHLGERLGMKKGELDRRSKVTVKRAAQIARLHKDLSRSEDLVVDASQAKKLIKKLLMEGYRMHQIAARSGLEEKDLAMARTVRQSIATKIGAAYTLMTS